METNKMETRDIFPLLMSMSLPMVLSMLVQSLYNIIDSIYVSYLGTHMESLQQKTKERSMFQES